MFQHGLTWPQAEVLMDAGAYVRRERWTDKRLFRTSGQLVWVDGSPSRVVRAADFGREEFLAKDWTNMGFDQGDCIDHPGWTHIVIDETARWKAAVPEQRIPNPPSWAPLYSGTREISYGVIHNFLSKGVCWQAIMSGVTKDGRKIAAGTTELVTYTIIPAVPGTGDVLLSRTIPNPFTAACLVAITGSATDTLLLDGHEVPLPISFPLAQGAGFTIAARLRNAASQPVAALNLTVDLTL